jgi:hypothetical protein
VHVHAWQPKADQEMTQQRNTLTSKQAMAVALSLEPPWHEPAPKVERILRVDFAATQAQAKEAAPSANSEGSQTGPLRPRL